MDKKIHPFVIANNHPEEVRKYMNFGWGNGYVKIPKEHPWYGEDYDYLQDVDVHGRLTYSDGCHVGFGIISQEEEDNKTYWIIGFDTNHSGDDPFSCSEEYVMYEAIKLSKLAEEAWN